MLKITVYTRDTYKWLKEYIFCDTMQIHDVSTSKKYITKKMYCFTNDSIKTTREIVLDEDKAIKVEQYIKKSF